MELNQIETLLLQEMEDVRGGLAGTCECVKGAGQSKEEGGKCSCKSGAGQISTSEDDDDENGSTCKCEGGAGQ